MEHNPYKWGRPRDDVYGEYSHEIADAPSTTKFPTNHTQRPIITGTSVIGIKFDKGVILAADNLGSYGSLARFDNLERLLAVGDKTVVGLSGDISDLQYIQRLLEDLDIKNDYENDGQVLHANNIYKYLSTVLYNRRSKMNPLWNASIVGGVVDGAPFLSYVDMLGVTYSSPTLATGFGSYLAVPLLRKLVPNEGDESKVTEEQARKVVDECMKVLFYRDARSLDKYSVATITAQGVRFDKNVKCEEMSWRFAKDIKGYGTQTV